MTCAVIAYLLCPMWTFGTICLSVHCLIKPVWSCDDVRLGKLEKTATKGLQFTCYYLLSCCNVTWATNRCAEQNFECSDPLCSTNALKEARWEMAAWSSFKESVILGYFTYRMWYTHVYTPLSLTHTHTLAICSSSLPPCLASPSKTPLSLFACYCDQCSTEPELPTLQVPQTLTRH